MADFFGVKSGPNPSGDSIYCDDTVGLLQFWIANSHLFFMSWPFKRFFFFSFLDIEKLRFWTQARQHTETQQSEMVGWFSGKNSTTLLRVINVKPLKVRGHQVPDWAESVSITDTWPFHWLVTRNKGQRELFVLLFNYFLLVVGNQSRPQRKQAVEESVTHGARKVRLELDCSGWSFPSRVALRSGLPLSLRSSRRIMEHLCSPSAHWVVRLFRDSVSE